MKRGPEGRVDWLNCPGGRLDLGWGYVSMCTRLGCYGFIKWDPFFLWAICRPLSGKIEWI